ncbi:hypothetical protein MMC06_000192 [Schaereria dolodes]|nr:hypothetical protein [Schaereria dolodes]
MAPHKRGPWSQHEDQMLLQLVQTQGAHNWVRISHIITTRSPKQCRERFHQNLKPTLNHEPISPEEGILIEKLVGEMGKRWAEIARRLRGRSDNAVKNWWNGGMNRRRRLVVRREGCNRSGDSFNESIEQPSFARPISISDCVYQTHQNLFIPPLGSNIEAPLVSPVASESSSSGSIGEPPSLYSDRDSNASSSPKSVESPSIELPPPARPQMARLPSRPPTAQACTIYSLKDHTYSSYERLEYARDSCLPQQQNLYHLADMATSTVDRESCVSRFPSPKAVLPSINSLDCASQLAQPRDTRMNLSNLLS